MHSDALFTSLTAPDTPILGPVYWFLFQSQRLLVEHRASDYIVPLVESPEAIGLPIVRRQYLGRLGARHCLAGEVAEDVALPAGIEAHSLRRLFDRLPEALLRVAFSAVQIASWDRDNQYCGRCQTLMHQKPAERAKACPNCGLTRYPRISPAIIVAVSREDRLLLARSHRHPSGFHSVLAGFVEPGESLEEAVKREVREEVNIEVTDIRYFGSQPWPFPDSLMVAFTASYAGGEIRLEASEIAEAGWFSARALPSLIPPPISIARSLIDDFATRNGGTA